MADTCVHGHVRTPRGRGRPDGALHAITPVQLAAAFAREPTIDPRTTG
jgi:acetyl-CoA C-acetyltransferase